MASYSVGERSWTTLRLEPVLRNSSDLPGGTGSKDFWSLDRFIETDLTEKNWRDLVDRAALLFLPPKAPTGPVVARAYKLRVHRAAQYPGVRYDMDLEKARFIQKRFRKELAAIKRGDSSPAHTSVSRLLESRFDRLKSLLTKPPMYVKDRLHKDKSRGLVVLGPVYSEMVERICEADGCDNTFTVPSTSKKKTCCRADAIAAANARRKNLLQSQ